jgi:ribonuclease J
LRYTIHRGQYEIGGMCIEVAADDGIRILLDLGMPLAAPDGSDFPRDTAQRPTEDLVAEGVLCDIEGLYANDPRGPGFGAVVLTHAHLDHYGLAHHAHPAIPVFGSAGTVAILDVGRVFFPSAALPADLRVLPDSPLRIGSLSVTSIPVDHAAPDSRALLVEADGQRLLYTGDLRAHGRTGFRFEKLLEDERVRGVDWLLVEGTTLGAPVDSHGLRSEEDVEEELVGLAKSTRGLVAVVSSGQNVDRLVSCFKAAIRSGRQLVVDPYQAYILMRLAPLSKSIPQSTWDGVRVSFAPYQVQRLIDAGLRDLVYEMSRQGKVDSDELAEDPAAYLLCCRGSYGVTKLIDKVGPPGVSLVWSIWRGYWDRDPCAMRDWCDRSGTAPTFIHSGGHAWPEDLHRLVERLEPKQVVWVHTEASRRVP